MRHIEIGLNRSGVAVGVDIVYRGGYLLGHEEIDSGLGRVWRGVPDTQAQGMCPHREPFDGICYGTARHTIGVGGEIISDIGVALRAVVKIKPHLVAHTGGGEVYGAVVGNLSYHHRGIVDLVARHERRMVDVERVD